MKVVDPITGKELTEEGQIGELFYKEPNVIPEDFQRTDIPPKPLTMTGFSTQVIC